MNLEEVDLNNYNNNNNNNNNNDNNIQIGVRKMHPLSHSYNIGRDFMEREQELHQANLMNIGHPEYNTFCESLKILKYDFVLFFL